MKARWVLTVPAVIAAGTWLVATPFQTAAPSASADAVARALLDAADAAAVTEVLKANASMPPAAIQHALIAYGHRLASEGDYVTARRAMTLARTVAPSRAGAAAALIQLGIVASRQGDYAAALTAFEEAADISARPPDYALLSSALVQIGVTHRVRGDYERAIAVLERCVTMALAQRDPRVEAEALTELAVVDRERGRHQAALDRLAAALRLEDGLSTARQADIHVQIGAVRVAQRDYARAIQSYSRALAIREEAGDVEDAAALVATIAHTHLAAGDDSRALEGFERVVLVTRNQRRAAAALYQAGRAHAKRGRPDAALDSYGRSLALRESLQDWAGAAETLTGLTDVRLGRGEAAEALSDARRAIELARRARALEQLAPAQEAAARCLEKLGQAADARRASDEAIETAGRVRARDASRLAGSAGQPATPALDALRRELIALHAQMTAERARLRPDEARLAELDARIERAASEIARLSAPR